METKRVISIQDISCFGQCSETVALPVLSSAGIECSILPTAILSTHTAGFRNYSVLDLSKYMKEVIAHYQCEGIKFDALLSGYLGKEEEVDDVIKVIQTLLKKDAKTYIDPAMGDEGKLYPAFDKGYVQKMRELIPYSDYLLPNMTEASFLASLPYYDNYGEEDVRKVISALLKMGAKNIVITGLTYQEGQIGIAFANAEKISFYFHERIKQCFHGTGDLFSSAFMGAMLNTLDTSKAIRIAAYLVLESLRNTLDDLKHWYGVHFESVLSKYSDLLVI